MRTKIYEAEVLGQAVQVEAEDKAQLLDKLRNLENIYQDKSKVDQDLAPYHVIEVAQVDK